jgi:tRNA threonylcarbamoyladenosine modification (KEOPS) complex  Pcc1 subunit
MEFEFPDRKTLEAAKKSLSHEGNVSNRAGTRISEKNNKLQLDIEANDVVALRATANAFLRALQVIDEVRK